MRKNKEEKGGHTIRRETIPKFHIFGPIPIHAKTYSRLNFIFKWKTSKNLFFMFLPPNTRIYFLIYKDP